MPLFEYSCNYNHTIEVLEPFVTKDRHVCAKCENPCNPYMRRIISVPRPAIIPGGTNAGYGKR